MDFDSEVISKLKFIGKIGKGEKINVKNMYVQPDGFLTKISRSFINYDTRDNTFTFISGILKRSFEILSLHLNKKNSRDEIIANHLIKDITDSKTGIENLKETYADDVMFCCKLETLIEEIETKLAEFNKV
jgi:hypothetical protein